MPEFPGPGTVHADTVCYHCGVSCEEEIVQHDQKVFCCEGCKVVYGILNAHNLCTYYTLPEAKGNTPDQDLYQGKYAYLDLPEVRPRVTTFGEQGQTQVNWLIPSMHCSSCIWLLENLHRLHAGVVSAVVDFPEKQVRIRVHDNRLKLSELAHLMASIGYEPYISLNDLDTPQKNTFNKTRIYKIGISGFAFGNIMFLGLSDYFTIGKSDGLGVEMRVVFGVIAILLALPVFFYAASGFFVSAWKALKKGQLNIDAPIALAILVTFLRSLAEIGVHGGAGYLDSMTGIVFFMLTGRYFQDKSYSLISFDRDYKSYFPVAVTSLHADGEQQKQVTELEPGEHILIRNNELIPCDSRLVSESALIDYSFVSGEAHPVGKTRNEVIYAGGKLIGRSVELEVTRKVSQSYLTQLWNNDAFSRHEEEKESRLTAVINKYFTLAVFLIGSVSWVFWGMAGDFKRGVDAMTTVWIIACPCALLLSETFTNGNLVALFGKYRFYLKNARVLEKLAGIRTIVFDKTGTLTLPDTATVEFVGTPLTPAETALVAALAAQSVHPLSKLVHRSLKKAGAVPEADRFCERTGAGLEAYYGATRLRLGSARFAGLPHEPVEAASRVYVAFDQQVRGYFAIRSRYREGLATTIGQLEAAGYDTYLLSGDHPTDREFLGRVFPDPDRLYFSRSPEEKLHFIKTLQQDSRVLMLGDGLNDAGALKQSDVGVAVSDTLNNFTPNSDAILEGGQLHRLGAFIRLAKAGRTIVIGSFVFSLIYNAIGLFFAVRGVLSPVVAAILMPASSVSIILFTTLLSQWKARKLIAPAQP